MSITLYNNLSIAQPLYYDTSIAYVAGKCLHKLFHAVICPTNELTCDESNPQSSLNYLCSPGSHTVKSAVVGSRGEERRAVGAKIIKEPVLAELEDSLFSFYNSYVIPDECREIAGRIADETFSRYIDKYRHCGLNETNAVHRLNYSSRTETLIYDRSTWHVFSTVGKDEAGFGLTHQLMRLEEIAKLSRGRWWQRAEGDELLPSLNTLIQVDEAIKKCKDIELSTEVDYNLSFKSIPLGKVANFYRDLTARIGTVAGALLSPESISFLKARTLEDFAHHNLEDRFYKFERTTSGFVWLDENLDPKSFKPCRNVLERSVVHEIPVMLKLPATDADCQDLKIALIRGHVEAALQGKLNENSPYGDHLVFYCDERETCARYGSLAKLNNDLFDRTFLATRNITTICDYVATEYNRDSFYQTLSATIFGKIPARYRDICSSLFFYHLQRK